MRPVRRHLQIVFQDPMAPSIAHAGGGYHRRAGTPAGLRGPKRRLGGELLSLVKLAPEHGRRYPHEFSGGSASASACPRACRPAGVVVLTSRSRRSTSASQAGVLNLLKDLQGQFGLAYLFVAHNLAVVRNVCDRVAVMYLGKIVEIAPRDSLYAAPRHPYTQALFSAAPCLIPSASGRAGASCFRRSAKPAGAPSGCRFRTRCWKAQEICAQIEPPLEGRPAIAWPVTSGQHAGKISSEASTNPADIARKRDPGHKHSPCPMALGPAFAGMTKMARSDERLCQSARLGARRADGVIDRDRVPARSRFDQ